MNWKDTSVLITGGASFIGSHLTDALVEKGATVRIVDDLSSGTKDNIQQHLKNKSIEFIQGNLLDERVAKKAVKNISYVFHLAAIHGGRGFVDTYQAACSDNARMDIQLIKESWRARVDKIVFASSGCVYPNYIQQNIKEKIYLSENLVGPPYDPDNMYGWAKLTTEHVLRAYRKDYGLKSVSCRYFTVYGERGKENHAVIAMIAKAFIRQNPYYVWGDGTQIRNWTHVKDIVAGTILAAEKIEDGRGINLGTMERIKVVDAINEVFRYTKFYPRVIFQKTKPHGPLNRVCDNTDAKKILGWEPKVKFMDGLHQTIDWYFSIKDKIKIQKTLDYLLIARS